MEKLRVLSLFSGIGAFEQGLKNLNIEFDLVNYCEIDKYASKSYSLLHNVSESLNLGDITKIDISKLPDNIDLLTHGSPCQSFSAIGKREGGDEGSGTKSSLMWNTVEIIRHKKPKIVIWENVKAVLTKQHNHNFHKYINELESLGYISHYKVLNAKDFGVAQNRERIFVVSVLNGHIDFQFPNPITLNKTIGDYLVDNVDEKYILPPNVMLGYKGKKSVFKKRFVIKEYSDIAYCLVAKGGRAVITNNYLFADPSTYNNKPCENNDLDYMVDNDVKIRALSPNEYFRLQGFADSDFKKLDGNISDAQLYKQAGNSICVSVVENLYKELFKK